MKCIEKRTDLAAEQTDLPLAPDTNRQTQKIWNRKTPLTLSVCLWVERETEHCSKTAPRLLLWPKKSTFDILWLRAGVVELAWLWESWGHTDPTLKSISKYYVLDYTNWWPSIIFRLYKNNDLDLWWFDQTPHWRQYPRILFRFQKWPPTQRKQWSGSLAKIYLYAGEYT